MDWHARLFPGESNGGKVTPDDLDAALGLPGITALTVCGLDQKSFEHLAVRYRTTLTAIHFWKCPRIEDLSPLEEMSALTHVAFFWNQRATRLWDLRKTTGLRGLHFDDFTRLRDLSDLETGVGLVELAFGNAVWTTFALPSLGPLSGLSNLKALHFNLKKVADGSIAPLARLTGLRELEFSPNLFTTDQLAWLRARLPMEVSSSVLQPFRMLAQPVTRGSKELDVLVAGKGKPLLSTRADSAKLQRYVAAFNDALSKYAADPDLEPEVAG
ncbi:hypothetical protein [Ramlibacter humi]|uniref:Leucine-rich repeat domain-containing protein n=1 Tax=Ramlibacter humi TaxID=2530451 RepID=A0A4Z0BE44_9BURK|nr:hypothetical protein [Ramlibacter humi]TFY96649.1 hypothetical protein EZ216_19880 [Ramlibacter humi]